MVLAGRDRERPGSAELSKFQIAHNWPLPAFPWPLAR